MNLAKIVQPNMNIARSINLDRDFQRMDIINDYHVTAKTVEILSRFADSLEGEKVNAWSLTGPYGMGKSAFVNYLLSIVGPISDPSTVLALNKIKKVDPPVYDRLIRNIKKINGKEGFFRVPVTAAYEPTNNSLARGLLRAIKTLPLQGKNKIQVALKEMLQNKIVESGDLLELFNATRSKLNKPMMVIVDEFGKNLDYMSTHYDRGDIFLIQQLAEMDSTYMWVCLHQSFDGYASGLSTLQRREWNKVQGRFEDISFIESNRQMLYLIEKALKHNLNGEYGERVENWAKDIFAFIRRTDIVNKTDFTVDKIRNIYPVHPVSAVALIELCTRFAQNDRTLLSFLCNNDRFALPFFLDSSLLDDNNSLPAIGLDYLYDYFFNISIAAYINRAESQRWIEIHNIIDGNSHLSDIEIIVLKTIGILNLLAGSLGLKADPETVVSVVEQTCNIDSSTIKKGLNVLVEWGLLLYRDYSGEFRVWEGSDFNIQQAINEKREKLEVGRLDRMLQQYLPLHPLVASRHSYQTGTVRRFERRWLPGDLLGEDLFPQEGCDGLILYCFGTSKKLSVMPRLCADGRPLVIGYISNQTALKELALDVAATRAVLNESRELDHDVVARKEIKFRIKAAVDNFHLYLEQAFTPGSEKTTWYSEGKEVSIEDTKTLSGVLSNLCDTYYRDCPPIRNEMISYEKLSSAASRARRVLVEAMLTDEERENLGLQGFGPEVALYKSLLQSEGFHVKNELTGGWKFTLDTNKNSRYQALWDLIDQSLDSTGEAVTMQSILDLLKETPFGLRQGPAPIFIILYLLVHSDSVAVFFEGTYRPYLSTAEAALMIKRPDLFTLKKYGFTSIDRAVFDTYKTLMESVHIEGKSGLRNANLIGVVGPLINFIEGLPDYTKNTRLISREASRVRLAIQNSEDPAQLIYNDLPEAVDIMDMSDAVPINKLLQSKLHAALYELSQAFPILNNNVQKTVLEAFNCESLDQLMESQRNRVIPLIKICDDRELKQFLFALKRESSDASEWIKGIAGIVMGKPIGSWDDNDLAIFELRVCDYVNRVGHLETLASIKGKLLKRNTKVFSIMMANGSIKRAVIVDGDNSEGKEMARAIFLNNSREKALSVLATLAEELLGGDDGE